MWMVVELEWQVDLLWFHCSFGNVVWMNGLWLLSVSSRAYTITPNRPYYFQCIIHLLVWICQFVNLLILYANQFHSKITSANQLINQAINIRFRIFYWFWIISTQKMFISFDSNHTNYTFFNYFHFVADGIEIAFFDIKTNLGSNKLICLITFW